MLWQLTHSTSLMAPMHGTSPDAIKLTSHHVASPSLIGKRLPHLDTIWGIHWSKSVSCFCSLAFSFFFSFFLNLLLLLLLFDPIMGLMSHEACRIYPTHPEGSFLYMLVKLIFVQKKYKLIGSGKFNHLINILTLFLTFF